VAVLELLAAIDDAGVDDGATELGATEDAATELGATEDAGVDDAMLDEAGVELLPPPPPQAVSPRAISDRQKACGTCLMVWSHLMVYCCSQLHHKMSCLYTSCSLEIQHSL
jgi:hypothetical protein